jgi:hypothetical protein
MPAVRVQSLWHEPDAAVRLEPLQLADFGGIGEVVRRQLAAVGVDLPGLAVRQHDVRMFELPDKILEQLRRTLVVGLGYPDEVTRRLTNPAEPLPVRALIRFVRDDSIREPRTVQ